MAATATPTILDPKHLFQTGANQLPAADTLLYTAPAEAGVRVDTILLCNTTASPVLVKMTHGAMNVDNAFCWEFSVPADGLPYDLLANCGPMYLDASDVIRGQASAADSVTVSGYGIEMKD